MTTFLCGVYVMYRRWRPDPLLSHFSGALAVIALSGAAAGIISLVGLRFGAPLIDAQLAAIDRALGLDTPEMVRAVAARPHVAELLDVAYASSFPLLAVVMIVLALTRRFEELWQFTLVFAACILACATISIALPARGAFPYYGYPAAILEALPDGAGLYHLTKFDYFRYDPSPDLSFRSLEGVVTFPSFHTCLALATTAACVSLRWLFLPALIWNALVIVSTIPVGGHYAIDLAAGAALWMTVTRGASAFARRSTRKPTNVAPQRALSPS